MSNSTSLVPTKPMAPAPSLAELATKANEEHQACCNAVVKTLLHALAAGDALIAAKRLCPHGGWLNWVEKNVRFSARTARRYVALAEARDLIKTKTATLADLTITEATRLIAAPKFVPPVFEIGKVYWTVSDDRRALIVQPSVKDPGYHWLTFLNVKTGELWETRRPVNLAAISLDLHMEFEEFHQIGDFVECPPNVASGVAIDDDLRSKIYGRWISLLNGDNDETAWQEAHDAVMAEVA